MQFNVLTADDNDGMRLLLKKAVEKNSSFKVIGEAADGESAVFLTESLHPDVVFLDVEMPGLNGLDCAKRIQDINPKIIIIFVTAHEKYMSDAFHLYAFDFMVKPFHPKRIDQTLDRIVLLSSQTGSSSSNHVNSKSTGLGKLIIRGKEGMTFIDEEEIILIQREERSTVVYTENERHVTSESMSNLEDRLDSSMFFRSHKSYIINLARVYKIFPYGRWTYIVKLRNTDRDALVTHEKYEELQKIFNYI